MKKELNGRELADYIKERQAREVRALRQAHGVAPKLVIIQTNDNPVINTYVKLKKRYGAEIQVDVEAVRVTEEAAPEAIATYNQDPAVHGIIVQLPLLNSDLTESLLQSVAPEKDVDALGGKAPYDPATPLAITWLLAGYAIDFTGKKVVLIGRGKLVGAPLERLLLSSGVDVEVLDRSTENLAEKTLAADIIITATGSPAILYPEMIKEGAVVVDAGVASEDGKTVGDVHISAYDRADLIMTPQKGGVGPLTVSALFENVIRSAKSTVKPE